MTGIINVIIDHKSQLNNFEFMAELAKFIQHAFPTIYSNIFRKKYDSC